MTGDKIEVVEHGALADSITTLTGLSDTPSSLGTAGQVLQVNSGGNALEFADAATGGGGSLEAVASGTLANGDTVIVNADGTVSAVSGTVGIVVYGETTYETDGSNGRRVKAGYDEQNDKVVIAYRDETNGNRGTAIVGQVNASNKTISFGTPTVFHSGNCVPFTVTYHPNIQRVVILYQDYSFSINQVICNVTGTFISTVTNAYPFGYNLCYEADQVYDNGSGKIIVFGRDGGNSFRMAAVVCTLTGNSISYGSITEVDTDTSVFLPRIATTGSSILFAIYDASTLYGKILTVSGTSITVGQRATLGSQPTSLPDVVWLPDISRFAVAFSRSSRGYVQLRSVSNTGSSATTTQTAELEVPQYDNALEIAIEYDPTVGHPFVFYNLNNGSVAMRKVTCTANSITYGTRETIDSNEAYWPFPVYDPDTQTHVVSYERASDNSGRTRVIDPAATTTNLTAKNYIGISDAAYADTSTATIQIAGSVDDAQSGLTAGEEYYVQNDGTLSATAGNPSVFAGTAVSSTKLIVKG